MSTEDSETKTEEETTHSIPLKGESCAVVFEEDETMHIFIPRTEGGTVTKQMMLTLMVQEMLKDPSIMQILSTRVMNSPVVSAEPETQPDPTQ